MSMIMMFNIMCFLDHFIALLINNFYLKMILSADIVGNIE